MLSMMILFHLTIKFKSDNLYLCSIKAKKVMIKAFVQCIKYMVFLGSAVRIIRLQSSCAYLSLSLARINFMGYGCMQSALVT